MAKKSTIGSVLLDAGIITISKDRCVCGCCKATGRAETLAIRHKAGCVAAQAVSSFIDQLHEDEHILPRVENPIELDVMLPYLADCSKEEFTVAEGLATNMFATVIKADRERLWEKVLQFEPSCKDWPDIKQHVVNKGLETNVDRINFRNWLVFQHIWYRKISLLEAQHYELECEESDMRAAFAEAFDL